MGRVYITVESRRPCARGNRQHALAGAIAPRTFPAFSLEAARTDLINGKGENKFNICDPAPPPPAPGPPLSYREYALFFILFVGTALS